MSREKIKHILSDLYAADPSLKSDEEKLIAIISQLVEARPDARIDERFSRELKEKLTTMQTKSSFSFPFRFVGIAGVAALALLIVTVGLEKQGVFSPAPGEFNGLKIVASEKPRAFGDLSVGSVPEENTITATGRNSAAQDSVSEKIAAPAMGVSLGMGGGGGVAGSMIAPYPMVNYKYVYKGDALELPGGDVSVYRRSVGGSGKAIGGILNTFNLGVFNPSSFENAKVDNISLSEDKDHGYSVSVSLIDETVSIYENWKYWAMPQGEYQPLTARDVPPEGELIAMTDAWLAAHGISTSAYGKPSMVNYNSYPLSVDAARTEVAYVSDYVNIVYPLVINGESVYDEGGNPSGLMVSVNLRAKKVSGVNDLKTNVYEESKYAAESSASRILKLAENGGYSYPVYYMEGAERTVEIELGTPLRGFVKVCNYSNNRSEELVVPALIFPVTKGSNEPYFFQRNVIVPLVKEILDRRESGTEPGGPIRIMEKPMPAEVAPLPTPPGN